MKILSLFLFLTFFGHSATVFNNKCIKDNYYFDSGDFYYQKINSDTQYTTETTVLENSLLHNFSVDGSKCVNDVTASELGLNNSDYNFLMALIGLLLGFSFSNAVILFFVKR